MAEHQTATVHSPLLDLEMEDAIRAAYERIPIITESRSQVDISVADGVVTLSGNVLTATIHDAVMAVAARTPGINKVIDGVYNDIEIVTSIARAFTTDPLLKERLKDLTTTSYLGTVTLIGPVDSDAAQQAAVRLAGAVAGVRDVINALEVR